MSTSKPYSGPFWIRARGTDQYVIASANSYTYTHRKSGATEFGKHASAEKAFDRLGITGDTHCIVPSLESADW